MFECHDNILSISEIGELLGIDRCYAWAAEGLEATIPNAVGALPPPGILDVIRRRHDPYRERLGFPAASKITGWIMEYNPAAFYKEHTDLFNNGDSPSTTSVTMISKRGDFAGGILTVAGEVWKSDYYGNTIFFDGKQRHSLSVVLSGHRIVLVAWAR